MNRRTLPRLRPGERLLWQGAPAWGGVACRALHIRVIGLYFAALTLINMAIIHETVGNGWPVVQAGTPTAIAGVVTVCVLLLIAAICAHSTNYILTTERVILQYGLALPATLSIPLHRIAEVAIRLRPDHTGDIALRLKDRRAISWRKLWPHARPLRWLAAEPMLRDIPHADCLAPLFHRTLTCAPQAPVKQAA